VHTSGQAGTGGGEQPGESGRARGADPQTGAAEDQRACFESRIGPAGDAAPGSTPAGQSCRLDPPARPGRRRGRFGRSWAAHRWVSAAGVGPLSISDGARRLWCDVLGACVTECS